MKSLIDTNLVSRREFLRKSMVGSTVLTSSYALSVLSCQKKNKRPNFVIIVPDDTGWNDVGYHGSEIKTPIIDEMAKNGVELDEFYVCPVCSPTRAALLTGRPPSRYGIMTPLGGNRKLTLGEGEITLPALLQKNGYNTAITGKWHLSFNLEASPNTYGFDYAYGYLHGQVDPYEHLYKYGDRTWYRNNEFIDEEGHATDLISNEAIKFIKETRDKTKPFFLYITFSVPHYPLQEEDKWLNMYTQTISNKSRQLFAASMTHMDDAIGHIIAVLKDQNLDEDTLVLFISDNGGQESWDSPDKEYRGKFAPNDQLGNNTPLRGWKGSLYEGGIRVPAIAQWNTKLTPRKVDKVMCAWDVYPTIASLAGTNILPGMKVEGINIWPGMTGSEMPEDRILYWHSPRAYALRKGAWKLIHHGHNLDDGTDELFNISQDPYEEQDLSATMPDKVAELKQHLVKQAQLDRPALRS